MPARWIFDELPPSGARRGDDPAQHAFRPDLATFVREVVQNANDQAIAAPTVAFSLHSIELDSLPAFQRAIDWPNLVRHLRATADTRAGARVERVLAEIERTHRIPLLCVEDRNTVGLTGAEDDPSSHFRALCKDTLFSHKREASAGGSYGLGKSVLWAFSGLRTVIFASRLATDPPGRSSPRLIGRAELPSHLVDDRGFVGSGWLGEPVAVAHGQHRAESLWGDDAERLVRALGIRRSSATGTTVMVVAVRDPTEEEDDPVQSPTAMLARIGAHAAAEFWPAITRRERPLRVEVEGRTIDARNDPAASPFCACLDAIEHAVDAPTRDGDVAVRRIAIDLPRRRDEKTPVGAEVDLVVRLAGAADEPGVGRIAAFRGPGMVVRRWDATRLATSLRPFHALLRCGTARGETTEDRALERFLRAAEPPGHDDWIATPVIKDEYVRGAQAALQQLHDRVFAALKEILAPSSRSTTAGPERLRRRLSITPRARRSTGPGPVSFAALEAQLREGRWWFEGEIRPRRAGDAWTIALAVRQVGEDGALGDDIPIDAVGLDRSDATARVEHGRARVEAAAAAHAVAFRGSTVPLRGANAWSGEIALELVAVPASSESGTTEA